MTTERQLRRLLGLAVGDGRRIVPITAPVETKFEPDWQKCLAAMQAKHPEIAQAKALVKDAERKWAAANVDVVGRSGRGGCGPWRSRRYPAFGRARFRSSRAGTAKNATGTGRPSDDPFAGPILPRNRSELQTVSNRREVAGRLGSRAPRQAHALHVYETGRITIDRYLDAVSLYTSAVAE